MKERTDAFLIKRLLLWLIAVFGLKQIKDKGYADKYKALNLPIYLVGIEFDKGRKNIKGFSWEMLPP